MKRRIHLVIFSAILLLTAFPAAAQTEHHRATRLGNPATRFAKPMKKPDDLRVMLRAEKMKADIAAILNTSRRTVEKHVERLMKKLGTENRFAAMRLALDTLGAK